jgi:hypothetical protein
MRGTILATVAMLTACVLGCGGEAEKQAAGSKGTIGVSVLTMTNPFFKTIADTSPSSTIASTARPIASADDPPEKSVNILIRGAIVPNTLMTPMRPPCELYPVPRPPP